MAPSDSSARNCGSCTSPYRPSAPHQCTRHLEESLSRSAARSDTVRHHRTRVSYVRCTDRANCMSRPYLVFSEALLIKCLVQPLPKVF